MKCNNANITKSLLGDKLCYIVIFYLKLIFFFVHKLKRYLYLNCLNAIY